MEDADAFVCQWLLPQTPWEVLAADAAEAALFLTGGTLRYGFSVSSPEAMAMGRGSVCDDREASDLRLIFQATPAGTMIRRWPKARAAEAVNFLKAAAAQAKAAGYSVKTL